MALRQMLKTTVLLSLLNSSLAASNSAFAPFSNNTSTSTPSTELSSTIPISDSSSSSFSLDSTTFIEPSTSPTSTVEVTSSQTSSEDTSTDSTSLSASSDTSTISSEATDSSSDSGSTSSTSSSSISAEPSTTSSSSSSAAPGESSTTVPPPTSTQESTTTSSSSIDGDFPTPPPEVVITGALGPITLGPQTSTETGDFESMQTGIPGLTTDSATQTSRDGHNTILPIWFLAGGIGIIKFPPPGINPGGIVPPPPGFPPLFIGPNGSPTAGGPPQGTKDPQTSSTDDPTSSDPTSSNPSSTSDSCTTATASSCVQTCTPISDAQGSSTVTCGQASCAPSTGCSATATTSTTTVAQPSCTSGCSECSKYQGDGEDVPEDTGGSDDDELDGAQRRSQLPPSIAGRISLSLPLEKRADDFDTFNLGTPDACTLGKNLKIPNYPKPNGLPGKAAGGAQMWWVMTETTAPNTCPVLDYNKVTDAAVTSQKINAADTTAYTKGGDWSRTNPTVNVDHVYELSILKQFFSSRVTAANCAEFKNFFDVADAGSPQVAGDTRLQTIWRQLPSNINPDFAGMDAKINAVKAQAFSKGFSNPSGADNSLGYLYHLALAFKLTNDPLVSPLFQKTNNRIYAALLGMDSIIDAANCGSTTTPVITGDWASSYKTWITDLLTTAGTDVNTKVSAILGDDTKLGPSARVGPGSTTGTDGTATATTNSIGRGVDAFLLAYPTPNAFTFNVNNLVVFPQTSTLPIKRQACSKPTPSASESSASQSASQTTVASSGDISASATSTPPISSSPISTTFVPPSSTSSPPPASSTTTTEPCNEPDGCSCFRGDDGKCNCLCS